MHRIVIDGIEHDLCPAAVAEFFSSGSVTTPGKRVLRVIDYTSIHPVRIRFGASLYCDAHGSSGCP